MISIDKNEVLRYLGYRGQTIEDSLNSQIDLCISICKESAKPRFIYERFNINDDFYIENSSFYFEGEDIKKHLNGAKQIFLMAATIGFEIEKKINFYKLANLNQSLILDACASAFIESVCDGAEAEIREKVNSEGKSLTGRFSPGYGDFPITVQKNLINLLGADKRIGLNVTHSNILTPRKSVTAVLGVVDSDKPVKKNECNNCNLKERCRFRRNGKKCIY